MSEGSALLASWENLSGRGFFGATLGNQVAFVSWKRISLFRDLSLDHWCIDRQSLSMIVIYCYST